MPTTRRFSRTNTTTRRNNTTNRTTNRRTNTTNRRTTTTTNRGTTAKSTGSGFNTNTYPPTKFSNQKCEVQARIGSYKNVASQFSGNAKVTAFSPTGANKWIKFVNNGTRVYKFNNAQFCKLFGTQWKDSNPTSACTWMRKKFGTGIKAVTRGRNNNWLIAATPSVNKGPFKNYNWNK